jgi:hypothetical protein
MSDDIDPDDLDDQLVDLELHLREVQYQMDKAERCSDPVYRRQAIAHIAEEGLLIMARAAERMLAYVDAGYFDFSDDGRQALIELVEVGIDRPDWHPPGYLLVLPNDDGTWPSEGAE